MTPSRPRFSICIPNYNYAAYIDKTISSVLSQTYDNFEIVVADNASTDNSVDVIQSFSDRRVRLVRNPINIGFAPNLDRATEPSRGEYLILLSSDDVMKQGALQHYAAVLDSLPNNRADVVITSDIDLIDSSGRQTSFRPALSPELRSTLDTLGITPESGYRSDLVVYRGLSLFKAVMQGTFTNVGKFLSTCYSRSLFDRVGGHKSVMSVVPDAHFSHKLMLLDPAVLFVSKALFQYRVHDLGNYVQRYRNISLLCDNYLMTQIYTDDELSRVAMTKAEVQRNFVRHWCLKAPALGLLTRRASFALRSYLFGCASYPALMFTDWRFYIIPLLVAAYPATSVAHLLFAAARATSRSKPHAV